MKRKRYGKEPGITLHNWVVKEFKEGVEPIIHFVPTKERAHERVQECLSCGAKYVQVFKAMHEFEEAWEN